MAKDVMSESKNSAREILHIVFRSMILVGLVMIIVPHLIRGHAPYDSRSDWDDYFRIYQSNGIYFGWSHGGGTSFKTESIDEARAWRSNRISEMVEFEHKKRLPGKQIDP